MKVLHLTSTTLLIGVLSVAIQAASATEKPKVVPDNHIKQNLQTVGKLITVVKDLVMMNQTEATAKELKATSSPMDYPYEVSLGMASVYFQGEGVICSAVHLKPWILLTAATCVAGRDRSKLYARVFFKEGLRDVMRAIYVKVNEVVVHPLHLAEKDDHNFALINTFGKIEWDVAPFSPPRFNYTVDEILKGIKTEVTKLVVTDESKQVHTSHTFFAPLTKNFDVCGGLGKSPQWYCVEKGTGSGKYSKNDIGIPLFFRARFNIKRLLGIYTGRGLNKDMKGHSFANIFYALDFINAYLKGHSLPTFL